MESDADVLDRWRNGDAVAGEQLFARHFDSLYRFVLNKADEAVDDLIQATFLAAVASRDKFRGDSSFRSYLFSIAHHELYAHWKKRARRDTEEDVAQMSVEDLGTRPSGVLAKHREQQLLLRALRSIPLELQVVVELHYWEELSGSEMAVALGVPEGTARSRLRRALERLEAEMRRIAEDKATLESSLGNLERWAASLRECLVA